MVKSHIKIYTYIVELPDGVKEAILACADGYTVYLNEKLDEEQRKKALVHALHHIQNDDFYKDDVQSIEYHAHRKE